MRLVRLTAALWAASCGFALMGVPTAFAVNAEKPPEIPFHFDPSVLKSSLDLPITDHIETITIPPLKLEVRVEKSKTDRTVEPIELTVPGRKADRHALAAQLARHGKSSQLDAYFARKWRLGAASNNNSNNSPTGQIPIQLTEDGFRLISPLALGKMLSKTHHSLTVQGQGLKGDGETRHDLLEQLKPFLDARERGEIASKIALGQPLSVDTDLLPEFPRRMVKKFVIHRGPNCFHAALAFQSPILTHSSLINVKEEDGYHRAMINYDELWRVIGMDFYEVNPEIAPIKYGDMIVFFDVPSNNVPFSYRWIRHTATYLFNGYTFSKGSKSPNTPYTVKTLDEEWQTWRRYTNNLGVKIFRRSAKNVTKQPPKDLTDWLY